MRHNKYLSTYFYKKMGKHEKYRLGSLSKHVKNAILTYNATRFSFWGIDKKLLNNCFVPQNIVNIMFFIREWRHFIVL